MSSKSEKGESNSLVDHEEETPTIGLNSTVVATGKNGLRVRRKFLKPMDHDEKVSSDDVNGCKTAKPLLKRGEEEEDGNEEVSSAAVSAETNPRKAAKSHEQAQSVSEEGEIKEKAADDNEAPEGCGSSESKVSGDGSLPHTCQECLKTFPSKKSLYGHLRCHPDRNYRGANKPAGGVKPPASSSSRRDRALPVLGWAVKGKRRQSTEEEEEEEIVTAAEILMIISQSKHWGSFKEEEIKESSFVKTEEAAESASPEKIKMVSEPARKCSSPAAAAAAAAAARTYQCSTCNKFFNTHQALGGHRASHIKHSRNNPEAEALEGAAENGAGHARQGAVSNGAVATAPAVEHRCKTCNETFATGQALGGHMRRHWPGPPSTVSSPESVVGENHAVENVNENRNGLGSGRSENRSSITFDLNEPPPELEEEEDRAPV